MVADPYNPIDRLRGRRLPRLGDEALADDWLRATRERIEARAGKFRPMTVAERMQAFKDLHFIPWGIYLPDDPERADQVRDILKRIGNINNEDERISTYTEFQQETESWQLQAIPGRWNGQQGIARSPARFRLVAMGRRSGKTYYCAHETLAVATTRPRSTIWIAAPIMKLVSRPWDILVQVARDKGVSIKSINDTAQNKRMVLTNGSIIEGVSCENVFSMAGAAVDFVVLDEAAQIMPEAWTRGLVPPLTDRGGQAVVISSFEGDEGFFAEQVRLVTERGSPHWEFFRARSYENFFAFPQGEQSPEIVQARSEIRDPLDYIEQFHASAPRARNLIYPQFKGSVHTGDYPFNPDHPVILAVDPSSGANEYAVAVIQDYGDVSHVIAEYYVIGALAEEAIQWCDEQVWRPNVGDVVMDSASPVEIERWVAGGFTGAFPVPNKPKPEIRFPIYRYLLRDPRRYARLYVQLQTQVLAERGLAFEDWDNLIPEERLSLQVAIESNLADYELTPPMREALQRCSHIFFDTSCYHTANEHRYYANIKRRGINLNVSETPRDYRNHLMDCLVAGTMVETLRGPVPIELVVVGDSVLTRRGYRRVSAAWLADPAAEVATVKLSDGSSLTGTLDHRVWVTGRGWVIINQLRSGDVLCHQSELSSTVSHTTVTQSQRVNLTGNISTPVSSNCCIEKSGRRSMGLFQKAMRFITRMRTTVTTIRQIWNAFQRENIRFFTGQHESFRSSLVLGAASHTCLEIYAASIDSVQGVVRPKNVTTLGSMTNLEFARDVETSSGRINISQLSSALSSVLQVVGVERETERSPVYDLSVEGEHEFFANGVLVHNCLGYWAWTYKRWDYDAALKSQTRSLVFPEGYGPLTVEEQEETEEHGTKTPRERGYHFLQAMRDEYSPPDPRRRSYLVEV